jgi:phosphate/sulfate permease
LKRVVKNPRLYLPPPGEDRPPGWIRGLLITTCGGVSFAHGSNDGQKGMGLILLVLIGFLPFHYALNMAHPELACEIVTATNAIEQVLTKDGHEMAGEPKRDLAALRAALEGKKSLSEVPEADRWAVRQAIYRFRKYVAEAYVSDETRTALEPHLKVLNRSVEFVPLWVVVCTALALGIGTCIGYKRIVVTVAEKIGKAHLTYAQGAAAETVAAGTILLAAATGMPVSTTHVLSSGVAGTMVANRSGVQSDTCKKIALAWVLTLPACVVLAGVLFWIGRLIAG